MKNTNEQIEQKKALSDDEYQEVKTNFLNRLFNRNKKKTELKPGMYIDLEIKDENTNKISKQTFLIDENSKLKPFFSKNSKIDGNVDNTNNASFLEGMNISELDNNKIKYKLFNTYNQKHDKEHQLDIKDFSKNEFSFKIKNVTDMINKNIEKEKKVTQKKENYTTRNSNALIENIPENILQTYEKKGTKIDSQKYTERMFEATYKIFKTPDYLNLATKEDMEILKPLFTKYKSLPKDSNVKDFRNVFNDFIADNKNKTSINRMGKIYSKTLNPYFKGWKKKLDKNIENELMENLEAIKNNNLPGMKAEKTVDYIVNPVNNAIYHGNNDFALNRNRNINNINTDTYVPLTKLQEQNSLIPRGLKSEIIPTGRTKEGNYTFAVLVPCKAALKAEKEREKAEKAQRNLNYKKAINDAKFYKKFGYLPVYETQLDPVKQVPLINRDELNISVPNVKQMLPATSETIGDIYKVDLLRREICKFTKEPYVPSIDYTNNINKKLLEEFVMKNPEDLVKHNNQISQLVTQHIKENINQNNNQLENQNVNANIEQQTKGRTM